ncbi:MAG: hypothetical protein WD651_14410 [Acidimicrobiia bacterium]
MIGILQTVFLDEMQIVSLIEDFALDLGIEGPQQTDLGVLFGDKLLAHRGDLDIETVLGQIEIGSEVVAGSTFTVPGNRKRPGLVLPREPVEVEQ